MDPLTRGALFHEVQYRLFRRTADWHWYPTIADEVLNEVAAEYQDRLAPAIPRVWKAEIEDLRADLHGWLRRLPSDAAGWRVLHSEYSFGMPFGDERDPASTTEPARILDGILLRGSVDWIEEHADSGVLRITDHKTGKAPKEPPQHIGKGQYLQPLLYAAAVENLLAREVRLSRLYFCTQRGNYQPFPIAVQQPARNDLQHALNVIDEQIAGGRLPASPGEGQCKWCDYQSVCGPREEERIRRKPALPLLKELRSMP
jgi:CRISPR/Cas system-associated exonuclease Cas4 (RecB family)